MNYSELKKMGNKVYSLTVKIEESKKKWNGYKNSRLR